MPRTLYEKLWDSHVVRQDSDGTALLYIDRHVVHEVTSPQAFDGLRDRGLRVRRPGQTLATVDHSIPTTDRSLPFSDEIAFTQVSRLAQNYNGAGGRGWSEGDFNRDGAVDFADLVKLAQNYNSSIPAQPVFGASADFQHDLAAAFAQVPEPGGLLCLAGFWGMTFRRRRRRGDHNHATRPSSAQKEGISHA
jgi:hypothetical protein